MATDERQQDRSAANTAVVECPTTAAESMFQSTPLPCALCGNKNIAVWTIKFGPPVCSQCAYDHYSVYKHKTIPLEERKLRNIIAAMQNRELKDGVRPSPRLSLNDARHIIDTVHKRRCSETGALLSHDEMSLTRRDPTLPFNAKTNCTLMSKSELSRRSMYTYYAQKRKERP